MSLKSILLRVIYHVSDKSQTVWLFAERQNAAGDNTEAFFRYVVKQPTDAKNYFLLSKKSPDHKKMCGYGPVINSRGLHHDLLFLRIKKLFLSHPETHIMNPFGSKINCYADLITADFIFLQHRILKSDLSHWLNRYEMNFSQMVTSAQQEYECILGGAYSYDKSIPVRCGLPRYDLLVNRPAGKIIVMPTWRQRIAGPFNRRTKTRDYNAGFKKSKYFKFYQRLLNDPRILAVMKKNGLTGEFYLHPSLEAQIPDFSFKSFAIMPMPYDYNRAFCEGDLLTTDYSSVSLDFAYLNKPVIFCHFDKDSVYNGDHIFTKSYIADNKFGPVAEDYESAVTSIIRQIRNGCHMDRKYKDYTKKFYFYHDQNNCARLLAAVSGQPKMRR